MKRKAIALLLTLAVATSAIGCGRSREKEDNTGTVDNTENQGSGTVSSESVMENTENGTEANFNQLQLGNALELPEGFEGAEGETDAHGELEKVLAQHLGIREENYESIRYYYNYVDLNGDSKNEILAMVMGEGVSEDGGSRLLWIDAPSDNITKDSIRQEFKGVSAPVYISNHMTEGYRDLILCSDMGAGNEDQNAQNAQGTDGNGAAEENSAKAGAAGGSNSYVLIVWNGERYQEINEGKTLDGLEGYEGSAIITNDMERDYRENTYHFLGEAMNL